MTAIFRKFVVVPVVILLSYLSGSLLLFSYHFIGDCLNGNCPEEILLMLLSSPVSAAFVLYDLIVQSKPKLIVDGFIFLFGALVAAVILLRRRFGRN